MTASPRETMWLTGLFTMAVLSLAAAGHAAPEEPQRRQVWAVLVGIERCEDEVNFPRCRGAARDAVAMARWMIEEAGWGTDHVRLLIDREPSEPVKFRNPTLLPGHRKPTKSALGDGIKWLARTAKSGDVALIFFAGHAVSLTRLEGDRDGQPPHDYLLPWDANASHLVATGWKLGEAIEGMAARGDLSILCIVDSSPTGRILHPRLSDLGEDVAPELRARMLQGIVRWPGVTAWMAATEKTAGETSDGFGLLTHALIQSLGTRDGEPKNLYDCLHRLRRDPRLAAQGFQTAGGFGADWSLWQGDLRLKRPEAQPLVQRGHSDRVQALGFSSDGGRMFTASMDATVRVWRTKDNLLLRVIPFVSNGGVRRMALSADGRLLVAGGKGDVLFFDLEREVRRTAPPSRHSGEIDGVSVLPGGRRAVTIDTNGRCLIWDVSGDPVRFVAEVADSGAVYLSAATHAGGAAFALAMRDGTLPNVAGQAVRLFDLDGTLLKKVDLPGPLEDITAVSLSDEGKRVVLGTASGRVVDLDVDTQNPRVRVDRARLGGKIDYLSIQPLWLMAGSGGSLQVIRGDDRPGAALLLDDAIEHVASTADGRRVVACGKRGSVRAWDIAADGATAVPISLSQAESSKVPSLGFLPRGDANRGGSRRQNPVVALPHRRGPPGNRR